MKSLNLIAKKNQTILLSSLIFVSSGYVSAKENSVDKPLSNPNQLASPEEAKALFNWAMVYLKTNGREVAYSAFNQADGKFVDRDLYLFCLDFEKKWKVMGANPKLVGQSAAGRKDLKGKDFVTEFLQIAKSSGSGTSSYTYKNPVTQKEQLKTSFIQKVANNEFCGMGYYNK